MSNQLITKRGPESALHACPVTAAASRRQATRIRVAPVSPFQGSGLSFAGTGVVMADIAYRTQLDPTHPGSSRRPPS